MRKPRLEPEAQRETGTKLLVAMTGKANAAKAARPWRMHCYRLLVLVAVAFAVSAHTTTAGGQAMRTPASKGYAEVNGVELYYEVHGDGPPLIMLHGGVTPSEMFRAPLAEMAEAHKVVALHARGHGLSKDSSRPWSHEVFADDVAATSPDFGGCVLVSAPCAREPGRR